MGFFGDKKELLEKLKQTNMAYINSKSIIFVLKVEYDLNLIKLFRDVYNYIGKATNRYKIGYLEKIEIKYFTVSEIIKNKDIMRPAFFRSFYNNIVKSKLI